MTQIQHDGVHAYRERYTYLYLFMVNRVAHNLLTGVEKRLSFPPALDVDEEIAEGQKDERQSSGHEHVRKGPE